MSGKMDNVLEIGTGCGYQTSVLAGVSKWVYTIERIHPLQKQAIERFKLLNLYNVAYRHGDGFLGWEEEAPFDAIIVTAAPDRSAATAIGSTSHRWSNGYPGDYAKRRPTITPFRKNRRRNLLYAGRRSEVCSLAGRNHWVRIFTKMYESCLRWARHRHATYYLGNDELC